MKLGVLISGRGSNLRALIDACRDPAFPAEIALVISNRPRAVGLAVAEKAGLPTQVIDHKSFDTRAEFDAAMDAALRAAGVELVCLAGFMRLLTDGFVAGWEGRMMNIHPSLLPAFKGTDVHARALAAGVKIAGCTVHFVTPEMDSGPIIAQAAVPVIEGDTPDALAARILEAEHALYPHAVRLVAEGRVTVEGGIARLHIDGGGSLPQLISPGALAP